MLDKFNAVLDEFNQKQEQLKCMFEDTLKEVVKEFLHKYANVLAIKWTGYIPYFNDGDPCEFGISSFRLISNEVVTEEEFDYYYDLEINGINYKGYEDTDLKEWDDVTRTYLPLAGRETELEDLVKLERFIYTNENLVRYLFGDHHQVIITREAITIEEYTDHD